MCFCWGNQPKTALDAREQCHALSVQKCEDANELAHQQTRDTESAVFGRIEEPLLGQQHARRLFSNSSAEGRATGRSDVVSY